MRILEFIYRAILRLYPANVRERDGEVMVGLFLDLVEEARAAGRIPAVYAALRVYVEAPCSVFRAHGGGDVGMGMTLWFGAMVQDVRFALRLVGRHPAFAILVTVTLAIGVGANTAVFSVVNAVLLRPLDFPAPEELVRIHTRFLPASGRDVPRFGIAPAEVMDFRDASSTVTEVGYYYVEGTTLIGEGEASLRLRTMYADDGLLPMIGVEPEVGRWFTAEEDTPDAFWTAVLSHGLWSESFGADPNTVGRTISLSGVETRVVGVMPQGFEVPGEVVDIYVTQRYPEEYRGQRDSHYLLAIGRLAPGRTVESAQLEVESIQARWAADYGHPGPGHTLVMAPLQDDLVRSAKAAIWLLFGAVGLILLIAAANVGNLLLARGEARMTEMSVRASVGAGSARIVRQMLAESTVLGVSGTVVGVAVASSGVRVARAIDPSTLPRAEGIALDLPVLAFTAVVALLVTVLFALAPAIQSTTGVRNASSGGQSRTTASNSRKRFREALVMVQVALSVVVVVGAGLLVRSFVELTSVDTGLETAGRLSFDIAVPGNIREDDRDASALVTELRQELGSLPGVSNVAYSTKLPFSEPGAGGWRRSFLIENRIAPSGGETAWNAETVSVRSGWTETLGIALLNGRRFEDSDGADTRLVALISEEMERLFWPTEDPIGKRFGYGEYGVSGDGSDWVAIVGVVENTRTQTLDGGVQPQIYLLHEQTPRVYRDSGRQGSYVLQTTGDPLALVSAVRRKVTEVDPRLAVADVGTLRDRIDGTVSRPRLAATLMGGFAAIALLLAMIGIYGVVSYSAVQRTREIGIRRVLGADQESVVGLIFREGAGPAMVGVAAGIVGALGLASFLETLLFQVSPRDPGTFGAIAVLLSAVALAAAWLPARRAARVAPAVALRND